jgi:hypothetical protein
MGSPPFAEWLQPSHSVKLSTHRADSMFHANDTAAQAFAANAAKGRLQNVYGLLRDLIDVTAN